MTDAWIPLESNPELLNKYAHKLGMPETWRFEDVFSLEEAEIKALVKPLAFLVLYPCNEKTEAAQLCSADCTAGQCGTTCCTQPPFFIQQHSKNACGAVALFHSLTNNLNDLACAEDSSIRKFVAEATSLSPSERGKLLGEHAEFRTLNDSVAQEGQTAAPDRNSEIDLHFVAVVRSGPCVYVLDGRRDTPTCVCIAEPSDNNTVSDEQFALQAAGVAKKLITAAESVHFSVMALTSAQ